MKHAYSLPHKHQANTAARHGHHLAQSSFGVGITVSHRGQPVVIMKRYTAVLIKNTTDWLSDFHVNKMVLKWLTLSQPTTFP